MTTIQQSRVIACRWCPNAIAKLCDKGVNTEDGEFRPADVVIYGTGFRATDFLAPMSVRGSRGVSLAEVWETQAYAYLGITVSQCSRTCSSFMVPTRMWARGRSST